MNTNKKIIIIGFGSIGQRHYKNLLGLGFKDVHVYDIDKSKIKKGIKQISRIDRETIAEFDIAFICNPNNLHIKTALICAQAGCDLFIEKPLSHNLKDIAKLIKICKTKKLISITACNMRFHPCLQFIKKYLDKGKAGKIYNINHEFGWFLPYWRRSQDYRKNYAAKRKTGGGIILDDIHEFDLLFWLNNFSEVKNSVFLYDKLSNLEIETEDMCAASFQFKNKVIGSVKCDYLQKHYTRNCKVIAEKGNLEWDFKENIVWLKAKDKQRAVYKIKDYDLNSMYIDEIKHFLNCADKRQNTCNDIQDSAKILKHLIHK